MAYTVTITGSGHISKCYVTVDGTKHYAAKTLTVDAGTEIQCTAYDSSGNTDAITENGAVVGSSELSYTWTYTFAVVADTTIELGYVNSYVSAIAIAYTVDPMAPHDGHNTNVGSVAREIEGGTVLIGGVVREIESGTVLVGGVAREIEFALGDATMKVVGSTSTNWVTSIEWDGGSISSSKGDRTYTIPIGTLITFGVPWYVSTSLAVYVNGVSMLDQMYRGTISVSKTGGFYDYILTGNITVTYNDYDATIRITEE